VADTLATVQAKILAALASPSYLRAVSDVRQPWHPGQVRAAFDPRNISDQGVVKIPPPGWLVICNGERATERNRIISEGVTMQATTVEWQIIGSAASFLTLGEGGIEGSAALAPGAVGLDTMREDAIANLHGRKVSEIPEAILEFSAWGRGGLTEATATVSMVWTHFWYRRTVRG
jgi:hypothetical protein